MICASCKGSAHPATGCQYTEKTIVCGRCVREFWKWLKGNTSRKFRIGPKGTKAKSYVPWGDAFKDEEEDK